MPDLSYSDDALNVRNAFFGAKTIIYVEGDDDVLFWHEVFSQVADEHFEVEPVGGAPTLDDYIRKISSGQLIAIAARDADFLRILGTCSQDPRIVYTRGYSVENSLYVTESVTKLARAWCKTSDISASVCQSWIEEFAKCIAPLVHLDVANTISASGLATIGDNCSRFMTSLNSAALCPQKIDEAVSGIISKIPGSAISSANAEVGDTTENILVYLRGHFLASAIHRFIVKQAKLLGRKVSISAESLYAASIALFSASLMGSHPHSTHYLETAKTAWQAV
ncbi:DUF4435 domain-containing protein [Hydrogenophaga sp. Root209]|uniref:DUF4435 domain-containing protein n=1 Tax=Hydrogenophaga sp. Root209 TaxID=1736490 RepID=UPI0009E7B3E0|nr:DUF4435 domain-containing protein [Hydrogenophaga sp. Root209]